MNITTLPAINPKEDLQACIKKDYIFIYKLLRNANPAVAQSEEHPSEVTVWCISTADVGSNPERDHLFSNAAA